MNFLQLFPAIYLKSCWIPKQRKRGVILELQYINQVDKNVSKLYTTLLHVCWMSKYAIVCQYVTCMAIGSVVCPSFLEFFCPQRFRLCSFMSWFCIKRDFPWRKFQRKTYNESVLYSGEFIVTYHAWSFDIQQSFDIPMETYSVLHCCVQYFITFMFAKCKFILIYSTEAFNREDLFSYHSCSFLLGHVSPLNSQTQFGAISLLHCFLCFQ